MVQRKRRQGEKEERGARKTKKRPIAALNVFSRHESDEHSGIAIIQGV